MRSVSEIRLRNVPQEVVIYYDLRAKLSGVSRNELMIDDLIEISKTTIKEEIHEEYNYYLAKILEIIEELNNKVGTVEEIDLLFERYDKNEK